MTSRRVPVKTGMHHEDKDGFGRDAFYAVTHRQEGGKA